MKPLRRRLVDLAKNVFLGSRGSEGTSDGLHNEDRMGPYCLASSCLGGGSSSFCAFSQDSKRMPQLATAPSSKMSGGTPYPARSKMCSSADNLALLEASSKFPLVSAGPSGF